MKIPIIINNRNLLTWTRKMVGKIKTYDNVGDIIIVDNKSTYEPLLEWYNTKPCDIIFTDNLGHTCPWLSGVVNSLNSEYYIVSDSDMGLDDTPLDTITYLFDKMQELKLNKIGLGLNRDLVLEKHPYYGHINSYETGRYENSRLVSGVYLDVEIDTTFALYNISQHFCGGASTWNPYVAKHYPWYYSREDVKNDEEFLFYLNNASDSATCKRYLL